MSSENKSDCKNSPKKAAWMVGIYVWDGKKRNNRKTIKKGREKNTGE